MVDIPSEKDQFIADMHAKGKSNKEIAPIVYPDATPRSGEVLVSRSLKKPHVEQYLEQSKTIALKEAGINWQWIIEKIKDAGEAYKMNQFTGEITPDHSLRLRAAQTAATYIRPEEPHETITQTTLPKGIDEIQMVRLMKSNT